MELSSCIVVYYSPRPLIGPLLHPGKTENPALRQGISPHLLQLRIARHSSPLDQRTAEMASESPQMGDLDPQTDTGQQDSMLDTNNSKRKADQTNGTHTRTKRNRYISIAWYELGI